MITTPTQARACCVCIHWHKLNEDTGECHCPGRRGQLGFIRGGESHIADHRTGCYFTCSQWTLKP